MPELEVKGGLDVSKVIGSPTEKVKGNGSKSVTLTFVTEAELEVFAQLEAEAEKDERTLSKYLVRKLKGMAE
jgi:hypothetical protein